jgi:hypothetical protein
LPSVCVAVNPCTALNSLANHSQSQKAIWT